MEEVIDHQYACLEWGKGKGVSDRENPYYFS